MTCGGIMKSRRVLLMAVALLLIAVAAFYLGRTSRSTVGAAPSPLLGSTCEVVLKQDALGLGAAWPTPPNSSGSNEGSKSSVVGTVTSISDEWLVVQIIRLQVMQAANGRFTTGTATPSQQVVIPRSSIAYIRLLAGAPAAAAAAPAPARPAIEPWSVLVALAVLATGLWVLISMRMRKKASRGFEVIAHLPAAATSPAHPAQPRPMPVE
jgi:hypothetical protein